MNWNVIARVGADDTYEPTLGQDEPRLWVGLRRPGDPFSLGPDPVAKIAKVVGRVPSELACDLLTVASAAFAADLRIPRSSTDDEDRWTRDIRLHLPVSDPEKWNAARSEVIRLLAFLTGDRWQIDFRQRVEIAAPVLGESPTDDVQTVCLFSGGLDSLVGAIDLLSDGRPVMLVGHHGSGLTNTVQKRVLQKLGARAGTNLRELMFYVQPSKDYALGEPSMRSRSVLFLALGVVVASALGEGTRLVVGENGLISLNVALTNSRLGSLSTRTTHPHTIGLFAGILRLLDLSIPIELPYRFKTKGEMLREARDQQVLAETAPLTMSCSHPEVGRYLGTTPGKHCGYCVPCIIRRSALNAAGMDHGTYEFDIVESPPSNATEKGRDPRAFQMAIERLRGASHSGVVAAVTATGPLPSENSREYVGTYVRGMNEVASLFGLDPIP